MNSRIPLLILLTSSLTSYAQSTNTTEQSESEKPVETSRSSTILGMSVTGNKESPRSLTIIPWRDPLMDGKDAEISPVWRPQLTLIDPDSYKRDVRLFLQQRKASITTK